MGVIHYASAAFGLYLAMEEFGKLCTRVPAVTYPIHRYDSKTGERIEDEIVEMEESYLTFTVGGKTFKHSEGEGYGPIFEGISKKTGLEFIVQCSYGDPLGVVIGKVIEDLSAAKTIKAIEFVIAQKGLIKKLFKSTKLQTIALLQSC